MNEPSEEQKYIIENVKKGYNIKVEAVAGSGKSTTILSIAKEMEDKEILQLTYNSSLRKEILEKVQKLDLKNIQIHTFHSLAVRYYSNDAHTDTALRRVLLYKKRPNIEIKKIDILVIDENQDLTELYYQFVIKFLLDMNGRVQIMCMGDKLQSVYEFKGADARYLTMADKLWSDFIGLKTSIFIPATLRTSYRITNQMGSFINNVLLGEHLMLTNRSGEPVSYICNTRTNIRNKVYHTIKTLIEKGVLPDDIFILSASLKSANIRKLENKLVENNIPCHIPIFETEKLDERVIEGKVVFSTFHSVKGRQRPHVILMGFDNNYFVQYARTLPKDECPNTIYVGCSRALEHLYITENAEYEDDHTLEFLKMSHYDLNKCDFVNFIGNPRKRKISDYFEKEVMQIESDKRYEVPSRMVQFIPEYILDQICPIIDNICIKVDLEDEEEINIPNVVKTSLGYEEISELNGIAIPCYYYKKKYEKNILIELIHNSILELKDNEHIFLKTIVRKLPERCEKINDFLFLANIHNSIKERLYFKLKQINENSYNWISEDIIEKCIYRMDNIIENNEDKPPEFEKEIIHNSLEVLHKNIDIELKEHFPNTTFRFSAIVDVLTDECIWELKCTNVITIEHKIQLIIYAWLWEMMDKPKKYFKLLNIKTGEIYELKYQKEELTKIIVSILKGKYSKQINKNDKDFLNDNKKYMNKKTVEYLFEDTWRFILYNENNNK
tara:strand:+ start:10044 stop:12221 length:2178 start_codon:yes stop_codon:yes gene_type:complete